MKRIRKLLCVTICLVMVLGMSSNVFAKEKKPPKAGGISINTNLKSMDLSRAYSKTYSFTDSQGELVTLELNYTPSSSNDSGIGTLGTVTNPASVGTWTSTVNYSGLLSMSYKFDLDKSGSQWKMSNARSHTYSGLFCKFYNNNLKISRALSTSTYPCEINGSVDAHVFDNAWIPLYTATMLMTTTVNSSGTMTLTWN